MKKLIPFPYIVGILFFAASCLTDPDCIRINDNVLKVAFLDEDDDRPDTLIVNSVYILGLEDTPVFQDTSFVAMDLPLNLDSTSMTYVINSVQGIDTFAVTYTVNNELITPECGLTTSFNDLEFGEFTFDPDVLILVDQRILNEIETNVQILF